MLMNSPMYTLIIKRKAPADAQVYEVTRLPAVIHDLREAEKDLSLLFKPFCDEGYVCDRSETTIKVYKKILSLRNGALAPQDLQDTWFFSLEPCLPQEEVAKNIRMLLIKKPG